MNSEKNKNGILCDIKIQSECVAFPCKEYIFMKDKDPWRWSVNTALHNTKSVDVHVFDMPGNSADLTPIEEVWNILKKKSVKLPSNKKKALE